MTPNYYFTIYTHVEEHNKYRVVRQANYHCSLPITYVECKRYAVDNKVDVRITREVVGVQKGEGYTNTRYFPPNSQRLLVTPLI